MRRVTYTGRSYKYQKSRTSRLLGLDDETNQEAKLPYVSLIQLPSYRDERYNGSVSCNPADLMTALCSRNSTAASIHECTVLPVAG
jgi:hypothetical protein